MIQNEKIGKKFFMLTVLEKHGSRFVCLCDCGNKTNVSNSNLRYSKGGIKSCGCLKYKGCRRTHGLSRTKEHRIWTGMKNRCSNKNSPAYPLYGGRGIKVCERWMKFENFLKDMGKSSSDKTLDRIDNNGNYEPVNCRWATWTEQQNNRSNNHRFRLNGLDKTLSQWADFLKINRSTIHRRIKRNWPLERILSNVK